MKASQAPIGASFSLHRCSELKINKKQTLRLALEELGLRRFRLMSYWNIHEPKQGKYDFSELDWQLDLIQSYGGKVTMSLGKRQPRWPECHMPDWAAELSKYEWYGALFKYIEVVVERYKDHPALHSWQLENEALLKQFGHCVDKDYSHFRLNWELDLIKRLDPKHPVVMTLSDSWGFPWRKPVPDEYAMSLYRITINKKGNYTSSKRPALFYKLRAKTISVLKNRPVFIHELQAEPWLAKGLTETTVKQQLEVMNPEIFLQTLNFAIDTGMHPIDLWGLEWWYWLKTKHKNKEMWHIVRRITNP